MSTATTALRAFEPFGVTFTVTLQDPGFAPTRRTPLMAQVLLEDLGTETEIFAPFGATSPA